jgi:hypothetical protein
MDDKPGSVGYPFGVGKVYDIDGKTWVISDILQAEPDDPGLPYLYELRDIHTGEALETADTYGLWIDPGADVRDATEAEQTTILKWFWHRDANLPNA